MTHIIPPEINRIMDVDQTSALTTALATVFTERARQHMLWGEQNHTDLEWNIIFGEEYGDVQRALVEDLWGGAGNLEEELIQTAAVAIAWLECIVRRKTRLDNLMGIQPIDDSAPEVKA